MDQAQPVTTKESNPTEVPMTLPQNDFISLVWNSTLLTDGTTKLMDLLSAMTFSDGFSKFLDTLPDIKATVPFNSLVLPGYTILHLTVSMTKNTKLCNDIVTNSSSQEPLDLLQVHESTEEEKMDNYKQVEICLEKGCRVDITNAGGLTPIHLAFMLFKREITDLLLSQCDNNSVAFEALSFFHIACATGNLEVVKRLLNSGAEINSQTKMSFLWFSKRSFHSLKDANIIIVPVNSTALHIAVTFQHKKLVEFLLNHGSDVYAQNALELTPIHLSMSPEVYENRRDIARLLLNKAPNLRESLSSCGLSHLHVAAYADDSEAVMKLLKVGSNIEGIFKVTVPELQYLAHYANRTPLQLALYKWSNKATESLIKKGADMFQQTPEIKTTLQTVLHNFNDFGSNTAMCRYIKKKLKRDRRIKVAIDANGTTLLHAACHLFDIEWAKKLLKKGADVNARMLNDEPGDFNWKGCTPMHLMIDAMSENLDKSGTKMINYLKLLMKYGADILATSNVGQTPLLLAYNLARNELDEESDYEIDEPSGGVFFPLADLLLESQKSYKDNPADKLGFSHFHYACLRNDVDIVTKFLDSGIDINHTASVRFAERIYGLKFTPLHFAVYSESKEVACLLIKRGADVNAIYNNDEETVFHVAILMDFFDYDLFEMLLKYGADINACAAFKGTPIYCYCQYNDEVTIEELKWFFSHGSKIDIIDEEDWEHEPGLIGLAVKKAKPSDKELILEEFINICRDKDTMKNNYSPIENIVAVEHKSELTIDFYLNSIQRFIDLGYKLDQRLENGKTALDRAISRKNVEALEALLLLGANVNIIDAKKLAIDTPYTREHNIFMAKVVAAYVWKMKLGGLKINEACETIMIEIHREFPLDEDFQRRCEIELAKLTEENIGESFTIRCLLQKWSAAMDYPTMSFVQRHNIDKFFAKPDDLRKQFPQFCGLLMMQYRMVIARVDMYEIAIRLLPYVLHVDLPALCLDNILKYFDNDELEYFIEGHE